MNTYLAVSSFLNAIGVGLIAASVLVAGVKNRGNRLFAWFLGCVTAWACFYFLWRITPDEKTATFFCRSLMVAAVFIPVTLVHFLSHLTVGRATWPVYVGYIFSGFFTCTAGTDWLVQSVVMTENYGLWPRGGPVFSISLVFFSVYTLYSWKMIAEQAMKGTSDLDRQLRYILIALVVGFVGGATNFPLWYGVEIPPVGNGLVFVYCAMMAHAVIKYRLPEVSIDIARGVMLTFLTLTVAVMYVVVYAIGALFFSQELSFAEIVRQFVLGAVVCTFFSWIVPRLKLGTDKLMEYTLFRGRYFHRKLLRDLANRIPSINDEKELFKDCIETITGALSIDRAAVYFRGELQSGFHLRSAFGYDSTDKIPETILDENPLAQMLVREQTSIFYQEQEAAAMRIQNTEISRLQKTFRFEVLVPIHGQQVMLGFLLLGHPKREGYYSPLDISLIESIGLQLGFVMRSRQLERRANQAEKLISLGTLAAGLAHELRNPLVSIQTFTQLAQDKEHSADPEFQQEFAQVMQRDISRIQSIVDSVAAFAANKQVEMRSIDMREVIRSVEDITGDHRRQLRLFFDWPRNQAGMVVANHGQLMQVFLNLTNNAMHALENNPAPKIQITWQPEFSSEGRWLRIEFSDNGSGIDRQVISRIFDPFITTKDTGSDNRRRGMGLGLAIVKRAIDGHKGHIGVESELGKGTRFIILLPAPEST